MSKTKIDKELEKIISKFPHTDDDFIFVIRGKISTRDLFFACKGKEGDFGYAVLNLCAGNKQISHEIDVMNRVRNNRN